MRRTVKAAIGGAVAIGSVLTLTTPANAVSYSNGNYGAYAYEGSYPTIAACAGTFSTIYTRTGYQYAGHSITLRLLYSSKCGAYARIDGAPVNTCQTILDRSNNPYDTASWSSVWETVDSGLTYAYTKMGNDLNGRLARAAVWCGGSSPVWQTNWY